MDGWTTRHPRAIVEVATSAFQGHVRGSAPQQGTCRLYLAVQRVLAAPGLPWTRRDQSSRAADSWLGVQG